MLKNVILGLSLTIVSFFSATLWGQDTIGPKIGASIENFSLNDQSGNRRDFSEFLKKGPVALVFFRSAGW